MLWDSIEKDDLSGVVNLLQKGDINLEERDIVCLLHYVNTPMQADMISPVGNMFSLGFGSVWVLLLGPANFLSWRLLVVRKPVFGVSDQVRHKPDCATAADG